MTETKNKKNNKFVCAWKGNNWIVGIKFACGHTHYATWAKFNAITSKTAAFVLGWAKNGRLFCNCEEWN